MQCFQVAAAALAILQGSVWDQHHRPVAAVTVTLQMESSNQTTSVLTDSQGRYTFQALRQGSYKVRVESTTVGPFPVKSSTEIDVTIQAPKLPEFFDEPTFTVAGVTDASSHGGHGSAAILRSGETLAEATAALGKNTYDSAPLQTVRAYQKAAEADPSEANLFNWGAELLRHRAALQSRQIFSRGSVSFPSSVRMLLGLGAADFALGSFDRAAEQFVAASDLNPDNPEPYLFMGKVLGNGVMQSESLRQKLGRFAKLQPDNAWANYYYGMSLLRHGAPAEVESLLNKAIALDPNFGEAHLALGILHAERKDFAGAIAFYQRAADVKPNLEQARYRLGQAYLHLGEKAKASQEFDLYRQLSRTAAEQAEHKRSEIQEFVFDLKKAQ